MREHAHFRSAPVAAERPARSAGRRTLTASLPPRAAATASDDHAGPAPATSAVPAGDPHLAQWLDDAVRPDLAPGVREGAPIQCREPDSADMQRTEQPVAVATTSGPSYYGNGAFTWLVTFSLGNAATENGWIVQHVTVASTGGDDAGACEFWEAWPVKQGTRQPPGGSLLGAFYNDAYLNEDRSRAGTFKVTGRLAFFAGTLPDSFAVGNVEKAGLAYSTASRPSFWNDAGTAHSLDAKWNGDGLEHFITSPATAVSDLSAQPKVEFSSSDDDEIDTSNQQVFGNTPPTAEQSDEQQVRKSNPQPKNPQPRKKPPIPFGKPEVTTSPVEAVETMGGTWRIINPDYLEGVTTTYAQRSEAARKREEEKASEEPTKDRRIGVKATIQFTPNTTVNATGIGLTQMVIHYVDGVPSEAGGRASMMAGGPADELPDPPTTIAEGKGGVIDQLTEKRDPMYASVKPSSFATPKEPGDNAADPYHGQYGFAHPELGLVQVALLHDEPLDASARGVKNSGQIFETTALAMDGDQKGTYYGSVRWGWMRGEDGVFTILPLSVVSMGVPSRAFRRAALMWNEGSNDGIRSNIPLPISDPEDPSDPNARYQKAIESAGEK
jgi:hypothetical protein